MAFKRRKKVAVNWRKSVPVSRKKKAAVSRKKKALMDHLHRKDPSQNHLTGVAEHSLGFFDETASRALEELGEGQPQSGDVFAVLNTLTNDQAVRNFGGVNRAQAQDLHILSTEPAIARIVVADKLGNTRTYFISRATPNRSPSDGSLVASYRSPLGRLASLSVGSHIELRNKGRPSEVQVLERAVLRPKLFTGKWDSVDSTVEGTTFVPVTVKSFRDLLRPTAAEREGADLLETMLAEDRTAGNVVEGLRRSVIAKTELRDQPLLDQYQDEIFRLPLDIRLAILGPPGTGKTTTLIKRLGLKLDAEYLTEEEREQVRGTRSAFPWFESYQAASASL
jgi:flagellar biosynthesis GTPase FlhF